MWPFTSPRRKAVVVLHVDHEGVAKGAWFRGDADILIIDERDPWNRIYRMDGEAPDDELRRRIGDHPLGRLLDAPVENTHGRAPVLNLHWRIDGAQAN